MAAVMCKVILWKQKWRRVSVEEAKWSYISAKSNEVEFCDLTGTDPSSVHLKISNL